MKENNKKVGDTVLTKQKCKDKFTSSFNKTLYVVVYHKETQIIAENNQKHRVKRNVSHFKKFENTVYRSYKTKNELDGDLVGNSSDEVRNDNERKHESEETFSRWQKSMNTACTLWTFRSI